MKWLFMVFSSVMLIIVAFQGYAQNIDCRSCHAPAGVSGIRDFSQYYIHPPDGHPVGHGLIFNHPVGQKYPANLNASQEINCFVRSAPRRRNIAVRGIKNRYNGLPACKKTFNPPNGQSAGITFFDRNGNGQPDSDEVQLFAATDEVTGEVIGENDAVTVECASCHKAHENDQTSANDSANFYLRIKNGRSALCLTCHNK